MRQGGHPVFVAICAAAVLVCGCGKNKEGTPTAPANGAPTGQQAPAQPQTPAATDGAGGAVPSPAEPAPMAEQNRRALTRMSQGEEIEAVTPATLKGLVPETLAGMKRTGVSTERNQQMGIDMTGAEARFEGENGASLSLIITDVGNVSGPMRLGLAAWTMADYNRQTDTGYEKTGVYNGFKGMEEYNTAEKHGTIRVFVAERFIIELEGGNVTMDALKQALGQIDLKRMASLPSGS